MINHRKVAESAEFYYIILHTMNYKKSLCSSRSIPVRGLCLSGEIV